MLLLFSNQKPFATGAAEFDYNPIPGSDVSARLILNVEVEGQRTEAILDTGAPFLVCSPELAKKISFDPQDALLRHRLLIRGNLIRGSLHRVMLVLLAAIGENLTLEATAFVPDLDESLAPNSFPSFLGFHCCLDRVRFAVDPLSSTFYFGSCS
ncbi:MAG: retropepsin-like aspartic protease [Acidobacteriota bacterium]